MTGYGICLIPKSWAIGRWDKGHKTLYAFGPFRFTVYHNIVGTYGARHDHQQD